MDKINVKGFKGVHLKNHSLLKYNTLGLDSAVENFFIPFDSDDIELLYQNKEYKKIIIGNGSNILLSKKYYDENYIFISTQLLNTIYEVSKNKIYVETGVLLSDLVWFAYYRELKGLEFLEDIPGTIGGAITMNAGAYGNTISEYLIELSFYNTETNKILKINRAFNQYFGSRDSIFQNSNLVILNAIIEAPNGNADEILSKIFEYKLKRFYKQPRSLPNAGSVFKRPSKNGVDLFVWKLIDNSKLRGMKIGDAQISTKHPGFIVNNGNASGEDFLKLIEIIKTRIKEDSGVNLDLEWKII